MGTKIAVAALLLVWIVINFALARPGIDTITVWGKIKIAIKGSNKAKMVLAENLTFPSRGFKNQTLGRRILTDDYQPWRIRWDARKR